MENIFKNSLLLQRGKILFSFLSFTKFLCTLSLVILIIIIPQINLTYYPLSTITSKLIIFIYFCIGLFGFSAFWIIKSKAMSISLSKIDIGLALLFAYIILNRYFFQTDYGFSIRFMELLGLGFLYIIIRKLNVKLFYLLLLAIVISGIIQAVYGNFQLLGYCISNHSGFKLTGSFFNPGPYAGFLASVCPIALGLYLYRDKVIYDLQFDIKNKNFAFVNTIIKYALEYVPLIGIISIILVVPATQSRASWLAVVISSGLLLQLRYKFLNKLFNQLSKLKKVVLVTILTIIIGASLLGIYHFKKGSSDGRLFIWKTSTEIIKDNPIFGVGFDGFKTHYMNYQASYFSENGETREAFVADNSNYAFNEFVQFIVENGCIGFILLSMLCFFIFKAKTNKEERFLEKILKISLLSVVAFACFSYPMQILPTKIILFSCLALLSNLDPEKKVVQINKSSATKNFFVKSFSLIVSIIVSYFGYSYTKKLSDSYLIWEEGLENYQYGNYEEAIYNFEQVYPFFSKNGEFLMNYGKTLSISKKNKKAIAILSEAKLYLNNTIIETALGDAYKSDKQYTNAELAYIKAHNMIPVRFYPLYLLVKLYDETNNTKEAVETANKVLEKEVKVQSTAIEEIKLEMEKILENYKIR